MPLEIDISNLRFTYDFVLFALLLAYLIVTCN